MDNSILDKIYSAINETKINIAEMKVNIKNIDKHLETQNSKIIKHEQDIKKINKILNIYRGKELVVIGAFVIVLNYILK